MKNKIKSFINRCTKTTYVGIIPRHHGSETVFDHEKFAELIVKDCMDIIQQNRSYASQHKWPAVELANVCLYEINKTFEVIEDEKEIISG